MAGFKLHPSLLRGLLFFWTKNPVRVLRLMIFSATGYVPPSLAAAGRLSSVEWVWRGETKPPDIYTASLPTKRILVFAPEIPKLRIKLSCVTDLGLLYCLYQRGWILLVRGGLPFWMEGIALILGPGLLLRVTKRKGRYRASPFFYHSCSSLSMPSTHDCPVPVISAYPLKQTGHGGGE